MDAHKPPAARYATWHPGFSVGAPVLAQGVQPEEPHAQSMLTDLG